jgi:hypothetical protein
MVSRTVYRRLQRSVRRISRRAPSRLVAEEVRFLQECRAKARRRADDLGAPAVWDVAKDARPKALALDPTGELMAEVNRLCADEVAAVAGPHLVRGSRPAADRARSLKRYS